VTVTEEQKLWSGQTAAEVAAEVLDEHGVMTHHLFHASGARLEGARITVAQLMHDQAAFLGRHPAGPVEWSRSHMIPTPWHPERDAILGVIATMPTVAAQ